VQNRHVGNQELFRRANERLGELVVDRVPSDGPVPFLCECADGECTGTVPLTLDELARVHAHPRRFVVLRGHRLVAGERVVEQRDGYCIVEKDA
jgi:hypothetical protein